MKTIIKLSLAFALLLSFAGCKKEQTGGKGSVTGTVEHHGKPIADAYIYIKFKATEFPGDDYTLYDTYVQANSVGQFKIPFYKGSYYLYAKGNDEDVAYPFIVKGGTSFTLRNKENLTLDIAVSEE